MSQARVSPQDLAMVVALACLTADRTPGEQKALERVAATLDRTRNLITNQPSRNPRLDTRSRVPCTYSTHHIGTDRAAKAAGVARCPCDGGRLTPPFTDQAKAEELVDQWGWSRSLDAVRASP